MTPRDPIFSLDQLEKAIAAQEALRGTLDDAIIDVTIAALRNQLAQFVSEQSVEKQRKQVTILMMDVVNSTRLLRGLDPEENLAIMDAALNDLAKPVVEHGGKVTRFMGDGFLAVFGLPKARENDPEMAVNAGLEILDSAKKIALDIEKKYQLEEFEVRIGINTGFVAAGGVTEAEGTMMGAAVNLAARLESAAPPGGLIISQQTYQLVRGIFDLNPGEPITAKGFPEPIQVYQVIKAKPHAFRFKTRGIEGVETPMVGRRQELDNLQDAAKVAIQEGIGRFVTVVGEAGVGKSRLLDEFEGWLGLHFPEIIFFRGRATLEMMDLPFAAIRDIFTSYFGILDDDPGPVAARKIEAHFRQNFGEESDHTMQAHFIGQLLGFDLRQGPHLQGVLEAPQQLRDRAIAYLTEFVRSLSSLKPVVVLQDDTHWVDESSLDILERMGKDLSSDRVLFVFLARPSFSARRPSWGSQTYQRNLKLYPLNRDESEHLMAHVLQKVENVPKRLSELIISNAEGNPFYMEELVRMLVDDGVIITGQTNWRVQPERLKELNIPSTLTGVIQARLDRLPESEFAVLQQASVIGKVFWGEAITYLNQQGKGEGIELEEINTDVRLEGLQKREIIFKSETSIFSGAAEYQFKHAILQEVTYESVLKQSRSDYHAKAAQWLINQSGERVGEVAGLIAGHLEKAGKNEEALAYLSQAAELAASKYAIDEAIDFYSRALALTPPKNPEKRYFLLMGLEKMFRIQGNRAGQREAQNKLASIIDSLADKGKEAELLIRKAWLEFWTSEFREGLAFANRAALLSEEIGDHQGSRQAYYVRAWMLIQLDEADSAQDQAEIALSLARNAGDRYAVGNTLNILGLIKSSQEDFFTALDYIGEFLAIAREIGDKEREITALNNLGVALTRLGDFQTAQDTYQQILAIAQETGDHSSKSTAYINLGWVTSAWEDWELAREYCETGIMLKREQEQVDAVAEGLLWLGNTWLGLDQPANAIAAYQESHEIRQNLNQPHHIVEIQAGLARAALAQNDLLTARHYSDEILNYLSDQGNFRGTWEPFRVYLSCYQVLQSAGDPQAESLLEEAYNLLQHQAEGIPDESYREKFLGVIPWHREIIRAWKDR